jgi:hypothetical protein
MIIEHREILFINLSISLTFFFIYIFIAAYLSLDTLLVRDNGSISFRAIPEDKPLEVLFMSPELQQKGELSEKVNYIVKNV